MQQEKNGGYKARLLERRRLSENTFEAALTRPAGFDVKPGQHIRCIYEALEREYSLISPPSDKTMNICVRDTGTGNFSSILASAKPGWEFHFTGPHGHFLFRPSERIPVFIATGTGIAPFVSMTRSGLSGFILLHGVQTARELYYEQLLRDKARLYIPCLSRHHDGHAPADAFPGRVTEYIENHLTQAPYDFYLCGRAEMIRDVMLLADEKFQTSRIYSERFY